MRLSCKAPYPPSLKRPPYPASPKSRKAIETLIQELVDLEIIRKVPEGEPVEITTPVIVTWHNEKARLVGDFRALNNYVIADRYPLPRIDTSIRKLRGAMFLTAIDIMKGFHQNMIALLCRIFFRIITHMGVYEYMRMPFGYKNDPSHFQRMMDEEFAEMIREGWLIIYIDDIIIFTETFEDHLEKLERVLLKCQEMNMTISMKKFRFAYS